MGLFLLGICLVSFMSFAFASQGNDLSTSGDIGYSSQGNNNENNVSSSVSVQFSNQNKVQAGNYESVNGQKFEIQEREQNRLRIHSGNFSADCECNLTEEQVQNQNRTRLKMQLSNGEYSEVKIMPDVASETALSRLRIRNCNESNNCSIELKEVGKCNGTQSCAAYQVQAEKKVKVFGLFRARARSYAQINAENNEVISVKEPWWMSLASDDEE